MILSRVKTAIFSIACEQALLSGQAERASRERAKFYERSLQALLSSTPRGFAVRSRVLARHVSLAQIGEVARRLLSRRKQS